VRSSWLAFGDEVDAHLIGGMGLAAIHQAHQAGAVAQRRGRHFPAAAGSPRPISSVRVSRSATSPGAVDQPLRGRRVADRHAHVHAFDMVAEQRARRRIGEQDAAAAHHQQRVVKGVEQLGGVGKRRRLRFLGRGRCGFRDRLRRGSDCSAMPPRQPRAPAPEQ
jgi:hypothetical protein